MLYKVDLAKALVCGWTCFAVACFHLLCIIGFSIIWCYLLLGLVEPGGLPIDAMAFSAVMTGSFILSVVAALEIKSRILKTKTENENLTSAFKANKYGDCESGDKGTNIHKESARDMTRLAFTCLVTFHAFVYSLEYIFGISKASTRLQCWGCVVCVALSSFLVVISAVSFDMNTNLASCISEKMKKSNETC